MIARDDQNISSDKPWEKSSLFIHKMGGGRKSEREVGRETLSRSTPLIGVRISNPAFCTLRMKLS
jgi:hypothetical protein